MARCFPLRDEKAQLWKQPPETFSGWYFPLASRREQTLVAVRCAIQNILHITLTVIFFRNMKTVLRISRHKIAARPFVAYTIVPPRSGTIGSDIVEWFVSLAVFACWTDFVKLCQLAVSSRNKIESLSLRHVSA